MESFNPTPEWLGDGVATGWSFMEVWGWPVLFATVAVLWAAPKVTKSVDLANKAGVSRDMLAPFAQSHYISGNYGCWCGRIRDGFSSR
jgi:hypothetical protein